MKTLHNPTCKMAFGRKDPGCPRCLELLNGAEARPGWGFNKQRREETFLRALKAHNCQERNCGPVCTFGDW